MLRPVPARWFEALVAHNDAPAALAALAATGAIELEMRAMDMPRTVLTDLRQPLQRYADLAQRFSPYWPAPMARAVETPTTPRDRLLRALGRLSLWHASAESVIRVLQNQEQELVELDVWRHLLRSVGNAGLAFEQLADDGPLFARKLYLFDAPPAIRLPAATLARTIGYGARTAMLVVLPRGEAAAFDAQVVALQGHRLPIPRGLIGSAAECLATFDRRAERLRHGMERLRAVLARLARSLELAEALGDIEQLRWFAEQVDQLPGSENFAWISGWSSAAPGCLEATLQHARHRGLIRFPPSPPGALAPLVLRNPAWIRPFELFARALGVPGRNEVDPSPLLALIVPLLFGYMFADVGQGLVLVIAGWLLGRRMPVLRVLVAGGLAAMVFGVLFGSVFSREDWIPALWRHPLSAPLLVLAIPIGFGVVLLMLGLALTGVQAYWRGTAAHWWRGEAGMLLIYAAAIAGGFWSPGWWLAGVGVLWYLVGAGWRASGELLEQVFQLAVNTLSFTRVGAFALAHAGLSSAIVVLAHAAEHPLAALAIMLIGNMLVLILEALVVSIQTTRLILFEFFIRFLKADGRPFRPLPRPPQLLMRRAT